MAAETITQLSLPAELVNIFDYKLEPVPGADDTQPCTLVDLQSAGLYSAYPLHFPLTMQGLVHLTPGLTAEYWPSCLVEATDRRPFNQASALKPAAAAIVLHSVQLGEPGSDSLPCSPHDGYKWETHYASDLSARPNRSAWPMGLIVVRNTVQDGRLTTDAVLMHDAVIPPIDVLHIMKTYNRGSRLPRLKPAVDNAA